MPRKQKLDVYVEPDKIVVAQTCQRTNYRIRNIIAVTEDYFLRVGAGEAPEGMFAMAQITIA
jgi:hypothetical protein